MIIPFFKLFAGIGLFLFGMSLVEDSLKNLAGRSFKLFLQRNTKNKIKAVLSGVTVTGVLQSSSVVSLMVLAFTGAGILSLKNSLAVILGAGFGTTLDSWVVAWLGFKFDIEVFSYPAVFAGGLLLTLSGDRYKRLKYFSLFLLGLGLLFIGLSFMKTSVELEVKEFDFAQYANYPLFLFLVIGLIITTIIQSSSTTIAICLSALYSGAITFPAAAAIVVGSEVGTSLKLFLGSWKGAASKKQLAAGAVIYNLVTSVIGFGFIHQLLYLITDVFEISNHLMGLVAFQSIINLLTVIIFYPFINPFAKFLERTFRSTESSSTAFLENAQVAETESAIELLRKESLRFINNCLLFNAQVIGINEDFLKKNIEWNEINERKNFNRKSLSEKYEYLKMLQGEIQAFYIRMMEGQASANQSKEIDQLISAVRSGMHSSKSLKDILPNILNLKQSSKDIKFDFLIDMEKETQQLYSELNSLLSENGKSVFDDLRKMLLKVQNNFSKMLNQFYKEAGKSPVLEIDITTVINFNRELFTSHKAIIMAVKDMMLNGEQAESFNELPEYLT